MQIGLVRTGSDGDCGIVGTNFTNWQEIQIPKSIQTKQLS